MRFLGFFIVAIFALSITNVSDVEAKRRSKRQTAKLAKKHKRYQSGISFLKFHQVAKLPFHARVKYINEFRSMFKDIEDFQKAFNPKKKKNAFNQRQQIEFMRILFGSEAFAAAGDKEHERGANEADRCIYGYSLQKYMRSSDGKPIRFPFGCTKPNRCYIGGSFSGYQCDPLASGLKVGEKGCYKKRHALGSTTHCEGLRDSLSTQNAEKIRAIVASAQNNFGFDGSNKCEVKGKRENCVDSAFFEKDEAKQIISSLVDTMYDDRSYAMLIAIRQLYTDLNKERARNGQPALAFPVNSSRCNGLSNTKPNKSTPSKKEVCQSQYAEIQGQFDKKFDNMIFALDDIFGDYMRMCKEPIKRSEVAAIVNLTNAEAGTANYQFELARRNNLKELLGYKKDDEVSDDVLLEKSKGRLDVNSYNVLQKPECLVVKARLARIRTNTNDFASKMPIIRDDAPPGQLPPVQAPPPQSAESVGCSGGGEIRNSMIFNEAARCTLCSVEKAVNNIGSGAVDDEEGVVRGGRTPQTGEFIPSKKWQSLKGVMMRACGTSNSADSDIKQMTEMDQIFASCDTELYDWNTSDTFLQKGDINRIQEWSNNNYWNGEGKGEVAKTRKLFGMVKGRPVPQPDEPINERVDDTGHFARIFGLSYRQATEIFCDKSQFDSEEFDIQESTKKSEKGRQKIVEGQSKETKKIKREIQKKLKKKFKACEKKRTRAQQNVCKQEVQESEGRMYANARASTAIQRRDRGIQRLLYASENHYIKNNNPDRLKSVAKGLESCMDEAYRRSVKNFDPDKGEAMCMGVVKINPNCLANDMGGDLPPGNVIVRDKGCWVGHQKERHGKNNSKISLAFKDIDMDYGKDSAVMGSAEYYDPKKSYADKDFIRKTLKKYPASEGRREELSIDVYYDPDTILAATLESLKPQARASTPAIGADEMTVQMPCRQYWNSIANDEEPRHMTCKRREQLKDSRGKGQGVDQ